MPTALIFLIHLIAGYVAWLLCFSVYLLPRLKSMGHFEAQRVFATIHSFRFFGLVFILPGVVGPNLPPSFAVFAAYGDFATGILALCALIGATIGMRISTRPLFWFFVVAFNVVGTADILIDYYHAIHANLLSVAGQLGAAYAIPILYVPLLMITHVVALYWLMRRPRQATAWNSLSLSSKTIHCWKCPCPPLRQAQGSLLAKCAKDVPPAHCFA
jgi:hypothetical protein